MKNVKVYQLNENDVIAAETLDQAKEYFLNVTGMSSERAFSHYVAHEIPKGRKVQKKDSMHVDSMTEEEESMSDIIKKHWKGEPFLVAFYHESNIEAAR